MPKSSSTDLHRLTLRPEHGALGRIEAEALQPVAAEPYDVGARFLTHLVPSPATAENSSTSTRGALQVATGCRSERHAVSGCRILMPRSERARVAHLDADLAHAEPVVDARHPERRPVPAGAELQLGG